jgi:hypothetical protein
MRRGDPRAPLDALLAQLDDPLFVLKHRREPPRREGGGHVSPSILALSSPRSKYVRRWRRHARGCPACAAAFRYFGLNI